MLKNVRYVHLMNGLFENLKQNSVREEGKGGKKLTERRIACMKVRIKTVKNRVFVAV